MTRLFTTIAALTALGTASAQVPEAWKDWPPEVFDRVGVEPVELRGILGFDLVGVEPVSVPSKLGVSEGGPDRSLPGAVNAEERLMYARFKNGDLAEAVRAWLRRRSRDELIQLVETTPRHADDHAACDAALEALLAENGKLDARRTDLPDRTALRLADYFRERGDERCVPLYEQLLGKRNAKTDGWVPELYGLGEFASRKGRAGDAVTYFRKAGDFTDNQDVLADMEIEALRTLAVSGPAGTAANAYQQLLQRDLQPYRAWVALGDLAGLYRQMGKPALGAQLLSDAEDGHWGVIVKFYALRARAEALRRVASCAVEGDVRRTGFLQALRLYDQALTAVAEADPQSRDRQTERVVSEAQRMADHLRSGVCASDGRR